MGLDSPLDGTSPSHIIGRNDEYRALTDALIEQETDALYLYGPKGSGKTLVTRHVIDTLSPQTTVCYVSCLHHDTQYKVLRTLYETITGKELPTGFHTTQLYNAVTEALPSNDFLLVLDDVDFLLLNDGDTLLYVLSRMTHQHKPGLLIISANHPDLATQLDERIASSLLPSTITFDPYTAEEARRILEQRVNTPLSQPVTDEALEQITTISTNITLGLHWLNTAGKHTEGPITADDIAQTRTDAIQQYREDLLATFSTHHRILLETIEILTADVEPVHSGSVYKWYRKLCARSGIEPFTTRRISDFLTHLELLNLIDVEQYDGGTHGKTRDIRLQNVP